MKLHALYDAATETVMVVCSPPQRRVLGKAAEMAHHFCRSDQALTVIDRCPSQVIDDFVNGLDVLRRLSTYSASPLILEVEEIRSALVLACFTAAYGIEPGTSRTSLSRALLLLSQAAPFPVRCLSLPPTVEVFTPDIDPEVRATYELIRGWRQVGAPHAFLHRLHLLGRELRQMHLTGDLRKLRQDIESTTALLRMAMQSLAIAELGRPGDADEEEAQ